MVFTLPGHEFLPRNQILPAFVFLAALALLYSIGLASRSIWYDEAITLQSLAERQLTMPAPGFVDIGDLKPSVQGTTYLPELLRRYAETDVHPPLYFALAHVATLVFGNSLIVVRGLSLALVLASVFLYTRTLLRMGEPAPWLLAGIYGLSFAAVTTAQDARGYALVLLLVMAGWRVLATMRPCDRTGIWPDILLGLICGGLLLTHYFSVFIVVPMLGWRFLETARHRQPGGVIAAAVCAAVFAPWLPVMLEQMGTRPDQMTGFHGFGAWIKRLVMLLPGQVFSATHHDIPGSVQKIGRLVVLLLALAGSAAILARKDPVTDRRRFGRIAIWSLAAGLGLFLAASVLLDRWFDTLRYYLFFAPFIAYLAGRGAMGLGQLAAPFGGCRVTLLPGLILVAAELAMLNFGWETNRNRGGAYYGSIATRIETAGPGRSLAVIDVANGRGTLLAAAHSFPTGTTAYILDPDPKVWDRAARDMAATVATKDLVVLVFSIQRGSMEEDKMKPFGPITDLLRATGFKRHAASSARADKFYAIWERTDEPG